MKLTRIIPILALSLALVACGGTRRDSAEQRRELGDDDAVPTTSRSEPDGAQEARGFPASLPQSRPSVTSPG